MRVSLKAKCMHTYAERILFFAHSSFLIPLLDDVRCTKVPCYKYIVYSLLFFLPAATAQKIHSYVPPFPIFPSYWKKRSENEWAKKDYASHNKTPNNKILCGCVCVVFILYFITMCFCWDELNEAQGTGASLEITCMYQNYQMHPFLPLALKSTLSGLGL